MLESQGGHQDELWKNFVVMIRKREIKHVVQFDILNEAGKYGCKIMALPEPCKFVDCPRP
jgi:hypothetical protein